MGENKNKTVKVHGKLSRAELKRKLINSHQSMTQRSHLLRFYLFLQQTALLL